MTKQEISPKNDMVFKKIFGSKGNEGILKDFLESILDLKIKSLKLGLDKELLPDFYEGKSSRLDVLAKLEDGTIVNVEIQTNMSKYSDKRNLVYWSKLYLTSLLRGDEYEEAQKTICIWILDGEVYDFEKYHSKWEITEADEGKTEHFKDLEIHVIELKKFRKLDIIEPRKKEFWLWFIDHSKKELIDMACYSIKEVMEAKEIYEKITSDSMLMGLIVQQQMADMDKKHEEKRIQREKEEIRAGREELEKGKEEIKAGKEEIKAGKEEIRAGREELEKEKEKIHEREEKIKKVEQAFEEEKQKTIKMAKKLLTMGVEITEIENVTGISKEELLKLK